MSLINQVLNQLEQRGAHAASGQTQIRAVPSHPERRWVKPLVLGAVLLPVLAGMTWMLLRQDGAVEQVASGSIVASAVMPATAEPPQEVLQPASRLSYELSVLPLPDTLRESPSPVPETTVSRPLVAAIAAEPAPSKQEAPPSPPAITRSEPAPPLKQVSPQQRADAEYHKGVQAQRQGRVPEAVAAYEAALKASGQHEAARLALAALLQENGKPDAAEHVLQDGLRLKPLRLSYAMALARLQLARDRLDQALTTLQAHLAAADDNADYQAFYAALLQRQERHKEAVNHYQVALQLSPRNGVWRVGYAISLQALERREDAKLAYQQALATRTLSPELTAFVQQKLAGL
jgi:MSHA biogenesis protein MshN